VPGPFHQFKKRETFWSIGEKRRKRRPRTMAGNGAEVVLARDTGALAKQRDQRLIPGKEEHQLVLQRLEYQSIKNAIPLIASWYSGKLLVVTHNGEPLLHGAICETHPRMEIAKVVPLWIGSADHIVKAGHNISFRCFDWKVASSLAKIQVVVGSATRGMNRVRGEAQHGLYLKPIANLGMFGDKRGMLPTICLHQNTPSHGIFISH
jgi:hypothetical protein